MALILDLGLRFVVGASLEVLHLLCGGLLRLVRVRANQSGEVIGRIYPILNEVRTLDHWVHKVHEEGVSVEMGSKYTNFLVFVENGS